MSNTALLALSSPEGSGNYYSKLVTFKDKDTGLPFFKVVDCLLICKECQKLEREEKVKCTHIPQKAHWLNAKKKSRFKQLLEGDSATALREFDGMIEDDFTSCFPKELIENLFDAPLTNASYSPSYIYTAFDPNGGGPSQLGIVSGYYDNDLNFIVSFSLFYPIPII